MKKVISIMLTLIMLLSTTASAYPVYALDYEESSRTFKVEKSFPDVKDGQWYYKEVMEMADRGLILGHSDGKFHPNLSMRTSEFVSVVARCVGLKDVSIDDPYSQWNADGHWAAETMKAAYDAGWYDYDEIPPSNQSYKQPIKRKIAAKILVNAFTPDTKGEYSTWAPMINDFNSLDGRYYEPVFAAYEAGLILGDNNGNFNPEKDMRRNEASITIYRALQKYPQEGIDPVPVEPEPPVDVVSGGVSDNGWLSVNGTKLVNEKKEVVMLRGMSSHGIQWFPQFANKHSIKTTRDSGANVFRVAMYTAENGYISNNNLKNTVFKAVDEAIALDMYVIIDWHILSDRDPNTYVNQAKTFFEEASKRYKDKPNVLYEICNEPNGGDVTWTGKIKPYAEKVIPVIRKNSPDSVVLVGTGTWSQDVDAVSKSPLSYKNVMYSLHFYSGTHKAELRNKATTALKAGTPLFVTEWGTSSASGDGGPYLDEAKTWIDFLEKNNISWVNWSLCNKGEVSAALKTSANANSWKKSDLSKSGEYVFSRFKG